MVRSSDAYPPHTHTPHIPRTQALDCRPDACRFSPTVDSGYEPQDPAGGGLSPYSDGDDYVRTSTPRYRATSPSYSPTSPGYRPDLPAFSPGAPPYSRGPI